MKICIGTTNQAKVEAVKKAFEDYEEVVFAKYKVESGVREQPFSDEETIEGALNRAKQAIVKGNGEIGIGLEGGVHRSKYGLFLCNWGALVCNDGTTYIGGGARLPLPVDIAEKLKNGEELGPVMEKFANRKNIRQGEGAIGIFTNGRINRSNMFWHVMNNLLGQYEFAKKAEECRLG